MVMTMQQDIRAGDVMNQYALESPCAQEMIAAAQAMGPALWNRAAACIADKRVTEDTVADFHATSGFKILQTSQRDHRAQGKW
jgi:3-hydroxy-9,10-secoandrosta-1,3,5(10)-triene-9,17-dione monooxygenase